MINILDTKWIRTKKGLKKMILHIQLNQKDYHLSIEKKQDIKDFIKKEYNNNSEYKNISKVLWKWFLFNKKECIRIQKYNFKINKILNKSDSKKEKK